MWVDARVWGKWCPLCSHHRSLVYLTFWVGRKHQLLLLHKLKYLALQPHILCEHFFKCVLASPDLFFFFFGPSTISGFGHYFFLILWKTCMTFNLHHALWCKVVLTWILVLVSFVLADFIKWKRKKREAFYNKDQIFIFREIF